MKTERLEAVIRKACARELTKMQEETGYIHDGWTGGALASWIAPGIIRSVKCMKQKKRRKALTSNRTAK